MADRLDGLNVFPIWTDVANRQRYDSSATTGVANDRVGVSAERSANRRHSGRKGSQMLTLLQQFNMWLQAHRGNDEGATAVEYGLMVALIAGVIVGAVYALGGSLNGIFTSTSGTISGATAGG
jgi:pilus assembly protein Flp/PilA